MPHARSEPAERREPLPLEERLAGRVALEQLYTIQFTPLADGEWLLVLRPRMSPIDKVIDRVILEGKQLAFSKMRIIEIGGDETITVFSKIDTAKKYSARELAEVFKVR